MRKREVDIITSPTKEDKIAPVSSNFSSPLKNPNKQKPKKQQQHQQKQHPQSEKNQNQLIIAPTKPTSETAITRYTRPRDSLISQSQRDALTVSAFGFGTTRHGQPDQSAAAVVGGLSTTAGTGDMCGVVVAQQEKESVRFHLCVEALAEGCIVAYTRLFYLSHRPPLCVDPLAQTLFTIPDVKLRWVRDQLVAVEVLRRQSEFRAVFECCKGLAEYFESERDHDEAAWHYEAALRYAMEALDRPLEQEVRLTFAAFLERCGQPRRALILYETMCKLARALEDEATVQIASQHMMRMYYILGEELRRTNPEEARRYFERAAAVAQRIEHPQEEAESYHALGIICEQMGDLQQALEYQRKFYEVAQRAQLREQEQKAALVVAGLQERMHMSAEAMASLQHALQLSGEAGDLEAVCHATMQLGQACKSNGDEEKALEYFRTNFETACRQKNQDLEDQARVALGFALGEHYFTHAGGGRGYVPIICNDVKAQLEWMSKGIL